MGLRNQFEIEIAKQLKKKKVKFKYEKRRIPYVLACFYIPDFEFEVSNGTVIIEGKGYFRPADKRKLATVKRQHPELDIRILFYRTNKKDIKWAEKHGFRWAIEKIPTDWLKGL